MAITFEMSAEEGFEEELILDPTYEKKRCTITKSFLPDHYLEEIHQTYTDIDTYILALTEQIKKQYHKQLYIETTNVGKLGWKIISARLQVENEEEKFVLECEETDKRYAERIAKYEEKKRLEAEKEAGPISKTKTPRFKKLTATQVAALPYSERMKYYKDEREWKDLQMLAKKFKVKIVDE